jgi:hypothetical protein
VPFLSRRPPRKAARAGGSVESLTSRNHSSRQTKLRPARHTRDLRPRPCRSTTGCQWSCSPWASDLVSLVLSRGGRSERGDSDAGSSARVLHLPGRQVLELDRAELADRMIGKTPVILDSAGLPRRGSVIEPVPGAIGERSPGTGCGISFGTCRSPPTVPQKRHAPHRPRRRMPPIGPGPRGGAGRGEPSPDTAWRSWRRQELGAPCAEWMAPGPGDRPDGRPGG